MTTKTWLLLLGAALLLVGGAALWFFLVGNWVMGSWAKKYQQTNATWQIQGVCTNVQSGAPIQGAQVTAFFSEPVVFKHHWRGTPLKTTNVVVKTDSQGRFKLFGEGGHVQIKVRAGGYREPESWEDWQHSAMNGISHVDTNVALSLQPASKPPQKAESPEP